MADIPRGTGNDDRLHLAPGAIPLTNPPDFDQQIFELKQEQELQKQLLLQKFQQKSKEMELQHQRQLETKMQYPVHSHGAFQELHERERHASAYEEQQQKERRDREALKRKENCSATASPEVKQFLNYFLLNRKQAASSNGMNTTSPYRNRGVVKSSSGESLPAGTVTSAHPYKIPQPPALLKYESDFPLRKTASEPNMLKIRLKQSVIERKARISGPACVRRQERLLQRRQQKQNSALTNCNSTTDSGPNSPPLSSLGSGMVGNRGSPTSAPIQEENEEVLQYQPGQRSSINDLALFSSPSLPNISLGRPHLSNSATANYAMFAAFNQRAAPPLVSAGPPTYYPSFPYSRQPPPPPASLLQQNPGIMPPQPSPVVRSASATSTSSSQASLFGNEITPPQAHAASLGTSTMMHVGSSGGIPAMAAASAAGQTVYGQPITDAQVAQAHLNKQGHRPLGRTQSAPLPLGHPMLSGTGQVNIGQTHYENSDAERQAYEHALLAQKIRQTVLTRASGREPQLKEEDDSAEVMDLTDKKKPPKTVLTSTISTNITQTLPENCIPAPPYALCRSSKIRDPDYLQIQRERLCMQMDPAAAKNLIRPLSRTLSSPLVHLGPRDLTQIPDTGQHVAPIVTSSSADHIPPVNLSLRPKRHLNEYPHIYSSPSPPHLQGIIPPPAHNPISLKMNNNNESSALPNLISHNQTPTISEHKLTTGLAYDGLMLKHSCRCDNNALHPEHSGRLQSIWARLNETDLAKRCDRLHSPKATLEDLQLVHTKDHAMLFGSSQGQLNCHKLENPTSFVRLPCGGIGVDSDTTWIENHTANAARMAAGCVIDLAFKTAKGDIRNGFAVVRPPGHHAEANLAMGFCFFNSVAIAAKLLRLRMPEMKRILIVDWDVHHGNGTQQAFFDSPDVLYLSIHRHDDGNFFPGTGGPTECGIRAGLGFNVNISWSGGINPPLGDAEYIAAFRTIVMPIAKFFNPDIILVSAGFDAAIGHPSTLGGYLVSPACFGYMTRELMQLANGKIVLALEGGYDLTAICDSAQECVRALLGDPLTPIPETELKRIPCQNAINTLQKTIAIQLQHWPCVRRLENTVGMSAIDALKFEHDECETVTAMAGLSMQSLHRARSSEDSEEPMDQDESK